jgi:KaiC/GvpD/RAD55 family RecA-like ATPase
MPSINHISAVYVTGIAGSGKSSSVIQMGLKLAVEIEDSGYMNTAVLPVATFESQIEIVSKSVGKGMEGMSVDNLHKMLKLAVIEQDEDAIATLSAIGIIAIDEATYVQAVTVVNDDMVELGVLMIL